MGKNRVVKILMQRDNLSKQDAEMLIEDVKQEIDEILLEDSMNYTAIEDIMLYDLGLEMDYIFDILY